MSKILGHRKRVFAGHILLQFQRTVFKLSIFCSVSTTACVLCLCKEMRLCSRMKISHKDADCGQHSMFYVPKDSMESKNTLVIAAMSLEKLVMVIVFVSSCQ